MAHRTAAGNAAAVGNAAAAGTAAAADTAAAAVAAGRSCQTAAAAAAAQRKTFSNRAKRSCFAAQSPCHAARSRPPAQSPCHAARCVGTSAPSVSSLAAPMISTRAGGRRARKGLLRRARRVSAAAQTCICETGAAGGGTSPGGKVPSPLDIFPYSPPSAPGPQATHTLDHTIEERFVQRVRGCQSLRNPPLCTSTGPTQGVALLDWTLFAVLRTGPSKHKEICRRVQRRWATGRGRAMCQ